MFDARKLCLLVALCGAATNARANPLDLYGFNPRALAMASSHTAFADDFTAVYYTPAALTAARDLGFGLGFLSARPSLRLRFERSERAIADLSPPPSDGVTFGSVFPLGGEAFRNRVAIGFGLSVPTRSLLNGQALDPAIPHWYMYQSLPGRLVAILGIGVMPFDWLSLGMGVQLLAGVEGSLDYELDVVAGRFSRKTVQFDIEPETEPLLGVELRPIRGLRIGVSYRAAIEAPIILPVDIEITGIARLLVQTGFRVQYTPHQVSLGASYDLEDLALRITGDVTWAAWSHAPDPSVKSSIDVGGELFEGTGLDSVLDSPAPGQERAVELAFRDIFIPRLGVEKDVGILTFRGGYAIRPSPAPVQTSGTNYVDATAHQLAIGAGIRFRDPFNAFANPLIIDAGASLLFIPRRSYPKIDPDDPVGTFEASGTIFVFGAALRYEFQEGRTAEPPPKPIPAQLAPPEPIKEPPHPDALPEGDADG
jgi:long-subunit fatty acid transport protein